MSMRKTFIVIIRDKSYDVYDIEGKEHESDGVKSTYWLYYSEQMQDGIAPPIDSEHFKPYHKWIERLTWDISFKQKTTTKIKWDELRFSSHTQCEIRCNNKLIYSFGTTGGARGLSFAFAKAQYL